MSPGSSIVIFRVSGISRLARRESTGLIRYFSIFSISAGEILPDRTTIFAQRTFDGFPPVKRDRHCSAESDRWSYCPGRYSQAITVSFSFKGMWSK